MKQILARKWAIVILFGWIALNTTSLYWLVNTWEAFVFTVFFSILFQLSHERLKMDMLYDLSNIKNLLEFQNWIKILWQRIKKEILKDIPIFIGTVIFSIILYFSWWLLKVLGLALIIGEELLFDIGIAFFYTVFTVRTVRNKFGRGMIQFWDWSKKWVIKGKVFFLYLYRLVWRKRL